MCARLGEEGRWGSLGRLAGAILNLNNDEVVVQVGGGDVPCPQNRMENRTAEIRFVCDMSLTSCTGKNLQSVYYYIWLI